MEYLIGVGLALVVCAFAMLAGFDRDRVFYPTLLTVIATYYILFAVMGSSTPALAIESAVAGTFLVLAVAGFKKNLWLVVSRARRTRSIRLLSSTVHSEPGCPNVVARLLPFLRHSRWRFPCHAASAAFRIRTEDLEPRHCM
jgi:hypothetical protein